MTRPLSQTGFTRLPLSPLQRNFRDGGTKAKRSVLDNYNERQDDRRLHPTKGFRALSVKRSRAEALIAAIRNGGSADIATMRRFLRSGL